MNKIDEYRAFMRNADGKLDLGVYNLTVNARAIKDGPIEPTLFPIHNLTEADYANYKPMCLNIISSETVRLPLPGTPTRRAPGLAATTPGVQTRQAPKLCRFQSLFQPASCLARELALPESFALPES